MTIKIRFDSKSTSSSFESLNQLSRHSSSMHLNRKTATTGAAENKELEIEENEDINTNGEYLVGEFIINISQMLCFPFAIDANEEIISQTYRIIKEFNLFNKLLSACISNLTFVNCDIPISLISRLIITDEDLVLLMIDQLNNSTKV